MVTQKEVAERAGVSFITVSRVINNLGNVRPETRRRVEEAIKELRYYPNRQAQALNNGLTRSLAMVNPRMYDPVLYQNYYVMNLLSGLAMRGHELGWDVLLTTDFDTGGEFDFLRVWHQRKVDGLVFVGLKEFPRDQVQEIESHSIPCVCLSDRIESPGFSWVDTDSYQAVDEAVRRLAALGHRHFAFLGSDQNRDYNPNIRDREAAFREVANRLGYPCDVFYSPSMETGGMAVGAQYLRTHPRATAVVAGNDALALKFIEETKLAGLVCPQDFSIVGFDAEPLGQYHRPRLASFSQPLIEMGRTAAEILIGQVTGQGINRQTRIFPLQYREGESVGPGRSSLRG